MITKFYKGIGPAAKLSLVAAFLTLLVSNISAAVSFSIMSTNLALDGQFRWTRWYESDSPEGAYLGVIEETRTSIFASIPLGRTVTPGRYYIAVKVLDYGARGGLSAHLGGGTAGVTNIDGGGFSGLWTEVVPIDVTSATTMLDLQFFRNQPLGARQNYLLKGVYITSEAERVISGASDAILNLHYPTNIDNSPPVKGNLIDNGSFEVGLGHGWGLEEGGGRGYSLRSLWDRTIAFRGDASLRLPGGNSLVSRVYRLKPNRVYTLSAWVRTLQPVILTLQIESPYELPGGYPPAQTVSKTQEFPSSGSNFWRLITLTGLLPDYPTSEYRLRLRRADFEIWDAWIDDLQLEEGEASGYSAAQPIEIGLVHDHASGIFFEDEAAAMQLLVRNTTFETNSTQVDFEIYDYLNKKVKQGTTNLTINPRVLWTGSLDLTTGKRGFFRVRAWVKGAESAGEEATYSIVPRPRQTTVNENSVIGIHAEFTDYQLEALQKLGIKWDCTASPSRAFRWATIEPSQGNFQWTTEPVDRAAAYGITVLGTIGQNWPAWADAGGVPNLDAWEAFVETVVARYKTQVKYWEIWNEPQLEFTPSFYASLLQRAIAAARRADPQAKIIGLGGSAEIGWSTSVLNLLSSATRAELTAVSTHLYPKFQIHNYYAFRDQVKNAFGLPVWNTEAGVWERGSYLGKNSSFLQAEDYAWLHKDSERYQFGSRGAPESLAQNFLNTIGLGFSKYIYYDGRIAVGPGFDVTHPTIFEYDDTIRTKGVVFAVIAWLFDYSVGLGNVSPNSHTFLYVFDRGGVPLAGLWSDDRLPRSLTISLAPGQFRVYDSMGNVIPVPGSSIPYNGTPVYIEGIGVSVADFRAALQAGVQAARLDTEAPNVAIQEFSGDITAGNILKFRWLALDDVEQPSELTPNGLQYSYRLEGFEGAWSPWTPRAYTDYEGVPVGHYIFAVAARDAAGNISSTGRVAVVVHIDPPVLICANNKVVECGSAWTFDVPQAVSTCCPNNVTISVLSTVTNGTCPQIITRTWRATDCCTNSEPCSQTVTVSDSTPPVLTCANNKTVECGSAWTFDPPSASDVCCGNNVTITVLSTTTNGVCPQTVTRTWRATDCCSNTAECTQTVTVSNRTTLVLTCGPNKTVECGSAWSFNPPTANDTQCGTPLTITVLSTTTNGVCPQVITRTWNATDCHNNTAQCSQTVTVRDTTPPTITCAPNKTAECGTSWTFNPPTASDVCCGNNVTIAVLITTTNGVCPQTVTRTWRATDCCQNSVDCSQTVTVQNTTALVLTCAAAKTVECGSAWSFDLPTGNDTQCGAPLTITVVSTTTNGNCPQTITRTWSATDCHNNSAQCSQTVTVRDTTAPTITCAGHKTVECGAAWSFDPPTASDLCCTNVTIAVLITTTNGVCPQVITRTWRATDCCLNSVDCFQTVTVRDTTAPTLSCANNKTVQCGSAWSFDQPTATDICCGNNITITVVSTTTNGVCPRVVTRTWRATDCCTNTVQCSQVVTEQDSTPLVLTCSTNKTVECGSAWSFDLPTANMPCGTNVTITVLSTVTNGICPRVITRTWRAVDCRTNSAQCSQAVTLRDTTPPVAVCPTNKTVNCGTAWTFNPPTATDACCGTNLTIVVVSTVTNGPCPMVTRTWRITDCCTNSVQCTQTVSIRDVTPPTINCAGNKNANCGTAWSFDTPTASDSCCGTNITIAIVSTITNGTTCPPTVTRTWRATDCCSNSVQCSQRVTLRQDNTAPTIVCAPNKTVECGTVWSFDPPNVADGCCGTNVTITVMSTTTNGVCPRVMTRTWRATDCCNNNSVQCSQVVTVRDTTPPVLTCASNKVVDCGATWSFNPPTVTDACCTNVTLTVVSTTTNGVCPQVITRTWRATDCCTNSIQCSQTVSVGQTILRIERTSTEAILSWVDPGFVLQEAQTLALPVQWSNVSTAPVFTNGRFVVRVPLVANAARYYQLLKSP